MSNDSLAGGGGFAGREAGVPHLAIELPEEASMADPGDFSVVPLPLLLFSPASVGGPPFALDAAMATFGENTGCGRG